ncbi:MAG TPA: M35 family metallo-endopeptidase [Longimicrobium sp.]|nr:M35 family metallo-endopeptidase [Longimicrobium sp.]
MNDFEDCPADWQMEAEGALVLGRKWIANVVAGLSSLPDPIPPVVATLLNRHFHTTDRGHVKKILGHFSTIASAINSKIDFECETKCDPNETAYVYSIWSDIHLCPPWHAASGNAQTNAIIHELAHDAANRDDKAYQWQPAYATLSPADAMNNADSYSHFAQDAF